MPQDTWKFWGPVHDGEAVLGVITALQSDGHRIRAVKVGDHVDIYINEPGKAA